MAKTIRKRSKNTLPYNWRQLVQALLAKDGTELSPTQITNVIDNRTTDPEKQLLVWNALKKVKTKHRKQQQKLTRLKKVA